MFEIGVSWGAYDFGHFPVQEEAYLLKSNGFYHTFPGTTDPGYEDICRTCIREGITMDNTHGPYKGINAMYEDSEAGNAYLASMKEAVDKTARYDIPGMVVHLSSGETPPRFDDIGYHRFCELNEYANKRGVHLFFENLRTLGNLASAMELFPDAGFCWDVGHEACFAYGRQYMPLFGNRLAALHIHDNFSEHNKDLHALPFDGIIDFDRVACQIVNSGFEGTLMLEIAKFQSHLYDSLTAPEYYRKAALAAQKLRDIVLKYKGTIQ